MEQLLLVTSCESSAGIGASLRTVTQRTTDGHTDVTLVTLDVHYYNVVILWKTIFFQISKCQKISSLLQEIGLMVRKKDVFPSYRKRL